MEDNHPQKGFGFILLMISIILIALITIKMTLFN